MNIALLLEASFHSYRTTNKTIMQADKWIEIVSNRKGAAHLIIASLLHNCNACTVPRSPQLNIFPATRQRWRTGGGWRDRYFHMVFQLDFQVIFQMDSKWFSRWFPNGFPNGFANGFLYGFPNVFLNLIFCLQVGWQVMLKRLKIFLPAWKPATRSSRGEEEVKHLKLF